MKNTVLVFLVAALATGCSSSALLESRVGPTLAAPASINAEGDVTKVARRTITTTVTDANGKITTTTEVVEDQAAMSEAAARLELALRKEERKEAVGTARAQAAAANASWGECNPSHVYRPVHCFGGAVSGGVSYSTGSGGTNVYIGGNSRRGRTSMPPSSTSDRGGTNRRY